MFDRKTRPEDNRLIKLNCFDWSPYWVVGKFIPFKPGSGKRNGKSRFCARDENGNFNSERKHWEDMETWEYVTESEG